MWDHMFLVFTGFLLYARSQSCPDDDPTLLRWSDPKTWTSNDLAVPTINSTVIINNGMNIKFDVNAEPESITIEPNGRLVWDSTKDLKLRTHFIHVKGILEIGSETCKYTKKAEIILKGIRNAKPDVPECGQKFICVPAGGTLELHGKDKLSWTKLDTTIEKLDVGKGVFWQFQKTKDAELDWYEGLRFWVVDKTSLNLKKQKVFYLSGTHGGLTYLGNRDIGPWILDITTGDIVGMAVLRKLKGSNNLSKVYALLEQQLGATLLRHVDHDDAYSMITVKGDKSKTKENIDRSGGNVRKAIASMDENSRSFIVTSKNIKGDWQNTIVDFGIYDYNYSNPVIKIAHETTEGWEPGDNIMFTSTDYDMEQTEIGTVAECPNCQMNQIRVSFVPDYVHWGKFDYNVDMRGEVAMLSRNIIISGEMQPNCPPSNENCNKFNYDTFGGQIKVLRNFKNVHVEGVELFNMGQQTSLGNYPLHFHMCHDMDDDHSNPPYFRRNSIHHTFARCITIHGSHGAMIMDNVCFDTLGHSIFLEDGGEKRTLIDGNLVAVTRKGSLVPSDEKPASYWITNPKTVLRNNVAAGSEEMGYWILFPDIPTGLSQSLGFMQNKEAMHTKFTEMNNNVAHSNLIAGLFFDSKIRDDLTVSGTNGYYPRTMPLDPKNPNARDDPVYIDKMTCFKNRYFNSWINGGYIVMRQYSSADSSRGLQFAKSSNQEQFIEYSVFLGETENIGEPTVIWNTQKKKWLSYPRSLALPWDPKWPIQGYVWHDGPSYADHLWFNYFKPTVNYTSGAIGFRRDNKFGSSSVSGMTDARFGFNDPEEGNRVFDGDETVHGFSNLDGDKSATFRDEDGTVSGTREFRQIVKPGKFYTTSECELRQNWKMATCPYKYAKLDVDIDASSPDKNKTQAIMVRDDEPDHSEILMDKFTAELLAILGGNYSYTLHWTEQIPNKFSIWGLGVEKNQYVRIGICMPLNAQFDLYTWSPHWRPKLSYWRRLSTIKALDEDTIGDAYFIDNDIGMLFLKLISHKSRTHETTKRCEGWCPVVQITVLSGDRTDGDCRDRAYNIPGKYRKPSIGGQVESNSRNLSKTDDRPPTGFGAGPQIPFVGR